MLLFIFIFCCYEFIFWRINYGDPIAHYGFSYALLKGEIPYVDFNLITTPLYAFYGSLGLYIWNNYTMFLLENTLLVTIMFYLLERIYGRRSYILLVLSFFFGFSSFLPTYNYFCFFLMIVLIYLEEFHKDKDYLIGFIIGTSILAKHTFGIFFVFSSLIFYHNLKKLGKRIIGLFIPLLIFLLYLVRKNAVFKFIDLCFLGLLDFSNKNSHFFSTYFYLSIFILIFSIFLLIKNKKDIKYFYLIASFSIVIPLFDRSHFSIYILSYFIMIMPYLRFNKKIGSFFLVVISIIYLSSYLKLGMSLNLIFDKNAKHFEYTLIPKSISIDRKNIQKIYNSYDNPLVLSYYNMQYDIINDKKINYFDVFLNGNFGYNGTKKMIKKIKEMPNDIIIINMNDYNNNGQEEQFAKEIINYIMKNYQKIEFIEPFAIYSKERRTKNEKSKT